MGRELILLKSGAGATGARGATGPAGSAGTPAPNITSSTAVPAYTILGNDSVFGFSGTITLPTADPDYSHLAEISVEAKASTSTGWTAIQRIPRASFGASTVAFAGGQIPQTGSATSWSVRFVAINESGAPTASAVTVSSISVQASAVTGFTSQAEAGTPEADPNRVVYTFVDFVPILNGGQVPQSITYAVSDDNGVSFTHIGAVRITSVGQTVRVRRPKPATSTTWKVAAGAGWLLGDPSRKIPVASLPAGYVVSSGFTVTGLAAPGSGVVTSIAAGTITARVDKSTGWQWAELDGVSWVDPTDVNSWLVKFYVRETNVSGTAAPDDKGTWREWFESQVIGGSRTSIGTAGPLQITYRASGDAYHYLEIQCVAVNRLSTNPSDWAGSNTASSIAQGSVIRVDFGALPAGALDLTRTDSASIDPSLVVDSATGLRINNKGLLLNAGFETGDFRGWTVFTGSAIVQTGLVLTGVYAAAITASNTRLNSSQIICNPGQVWVGKAKIQADSTPVDNLSLFIIFYAADGTTVTGNSSTTVAASGANTGVWGDIVVSGTAPAGTTFVALQFYQATQLSFHWFIDNVRLAEQVSTGAGMAPDGNGGVRVAIAGIDNTMLGAAAVQATNMAANAITAANAALAASSVVDGNVVSVGINKVTAGTSIFTGDVVLSRGISKPVILLQNTGLNLFSAADASTGATGLTSQPYVSIQSSGLGLFSGGNPSVTVNSTQITLWSVNGNTSSPYVAATSSVVQLVNGSNSVAVSASGITITQASGGTFTANSTGFSISKSSNSVAVDASGITITQASGATLTASSTGITISKGSSSVTITSSAVTIVNGVLTSPTITVSGSPFTINLDATNGFRVTGNGVTTTLNNTSSGGYVRGLVALRASDGFYSAVDPAAVVLFNASNQPAAILENVGGAGALRLERNGVLQALLYTDFVSQGVYLSMKDSAGLAGFEIDTRSAYTATAAAAGAQTLPANPVGFLIVTIAGTSRKIPYYA